MNETIEFMQKQVKRCRIDRLRAQERNAPQEQVDNIITKEKHYLRECFSIDEAIGVRS